MVGGPIITGIAGAPLLLIPSFATLFGGPIYLLAGVPVMLFHLRRHRPKPAGWALLALATFLALFTSITLIAWAKNGNLNGISAILIFGSVFAPIWGSVSGAIYHRLERDFFKQTL
ncbi:hypothetical protein [Pseudophaeobacter sp.]|uniref:hypothetical protein n=1 Tax=Pseudophaeobacter sp. TaxID=1971739 RepID=UPI0032987C06